jgi:hypothetical protein
MGRTIGAKTMALVPRTAMRRVRVMGGYLRVRYSAADMNVP